MLGQQSSLTNKKKPIVWGIPKSNAFPSVGMGNTAQTTNAYPKGVNSPNPTAGNITPASPGATGTQQGSNAPATTSPGGGSSLPPAGQDYASRLAEITKSANNLQTAFNSYKEQNNKKDEKPEKKDESEYLKYLRGQFNPDEAKRAQDNVNALNKRIADEIAANRKEQDRIQENEAGMVERGQTHLSTSANRESSKALADLAIAKGYSTDILKQYTDAGTTLYEAEQAAAEESNKALTLEEAQTLGVPFGTTMGQARLMGIIPTSGAADGFSLGENQTRYELDPTTGEYVRVAGGSGTEEGGLGEGEAEKYGTQLDFLINTAMDAMALSEASGVSGIGRFVGDMLVGDTKYRQLQTLTNTLRTNAMSLVGDPDIKKFFGPQMSDADVRLMTAANTSLNPEGQSPTQLYNEANRLLEIFQKLSAAAKEKVTTPEEGELTWETI